jgi:hypothetical protein
MTKVGQDKQEMDQEHIKAKKGLKKFGQMKRKHSCDF